MIEPKIVINEIGIGSACIIITPHIIALFFIEMFLSVFYRRFRLCITAMYNIPTKASQNRLFFNTRIFCV